MYFCQSSPLQGFTSTSSITLLVFVVQGPLQRLKSEYFDKYFDNWQFYPDCEHPIGEFTNSFKHSPELTWPPLNSKSCRLLLHQLIGWLTCSGHDNNVTMITTAAALSNETVRYFSAELLGQRSARAGSSSQGSSRRAAPGSCRTPGTRSWLPSGAGLRLSQAFLLASRKLVP